MDSASLESIATTLSILKDEQLPALSEGIMSRLDRLNGSVAKTMKDISDLQEFRTVHETKLKTMRWVGGVIFGVLTFFISVIGLIK